MRAVIQRAREASVKVEGECVGSIDRGMMILLGVGGDDNLDHAESLAGKIARLRIFPDDRGIPNYSLLDTGYEALVVSQFTLMADTRKGNRPGYAHAAPPDLAEQLYEEFVGFLRELIGEEKVQTGRFGAMMDVGFVNEGPYTLILESRVAST